MIARSVNLDRIAKVALGLTAILAALCVWSGIGSAPSVLFGGLLSVVNLRLIRRLVSSLMTPDAAGPRMSSVVVTKFLLLLALLLIALKRLPVDAASFLFGGGTLFVAIVLEGLILGEPVTERSDNAGNS